MRTSPVRDRILLPICVCQCKGKANVAGWALYDSSRNQTFPRLFATRKEALEAAARAAHNPLAALPPGLDAMFRRRGKELWPVPTGTRHRVVARTDHAPGACWRGEAVTNALTCMESNVHYLVERCFALFLLALAGGGSAWAVQRSAGTFSAWAIAAGLIGLSALARLAFELSDLVLALGKRRYCRYIPLGHLGGDPRLN